MTKSFLNMTDYARTDRTKYPRSGVQDDLAHRHFVGGRGKPHLTNSKSMTGFDNERMSGPVQYAQSSCKTR